MFIKTTLHTKSKSIKHTNGQNKTTNTKNIIFTN